MELKKLTRDNLSGRNKKGVPTVCFTKRGLVILSQRTVRKLEIDIKNKSDSLVDVFEGEQASEFFISKGDTYPLRRNGQGGAVFNCLSLCSLVIERTWRHIPHNATEAMPLRIVFNVCEQPADDEENSRVFALLRKKA